MFCICVFVYVFFFFFLILIISFAIFIHVYVTFFSSFLEMCPGPVLLVLLPVLQFQWLIPTRNFPFFYRMQFCIYQGKEISLFWYPTITVTIVMIILFLLLLLLLPTCLLLFFFLFLVIQICISILSCKFDFYSIWWLHHITLPLFSHDPLVYHVLLL